MLHRAEVLDHFSRSRERNRARTFFIEFPIFQFRKSHDFEIFALRAHSRELLLLRTPEYGRIITTDGAGMYDEFGKLAAEDAEAPAKSAGLIPSTVAFSDFVRCQMQPS